MPVEPSGALSDRLEQRLSELTATAAEELADWELSSMRDPRNWTRPVAAVLIGGAAAGGRRRGRARSSWCAHANSTASRALPASGPWSGASAAWPGTSRSASAARNALSGLRRRHRGRGGDRRCGEARSETPDPDQQVQEVVLGVHRDDAEQVAAVAGDEAPYGDRHIHGAEPDRVSPRVCVGAGHGQADQAGRDVNDVVPAVHVEDPQHAVDLAGIAEVGRVEEPDDA